MFLFVSSLWKS